MLCEVRYENFLSIKDPQVLQLQAESLCEFRHSLLEWTRLKTDVYKVLPIHMLYGANGSGKSNLLRGIHVLQELILHGGMKEDSYEPYLYQGTKTFSLGITFIYENRLYAYDVSCDKEHVVYEKLCVNRSCLFERKGQSLQLYSGLKAFQCEEKRCASFGLMQELFDDSDPKELFLMNLFKTSSGVPFASKIEAYMQKQLLFLETLELQEQWKHEEMIYTFLQEQGIVIDRNHPLSKGMKRYFSLMDQILERHSGGGCIIVDEMDMGMDPQWVKLIFSYLHDPKKNNNQIQLLFTTYQPCYLDKYVIRRDEVSFVSKEKYTTLKRLIEYANRENNYMRKYLNGEYGAVCLVDQDLLYARQ